MKPPTSLRHSAVGIRHSRLGFTLVELLAAMAVLAILVAMLGQVFTHAQKAWTAGESRVETFQNARMALELIGRELETALVASNNLTGANALALPFKTIAGTSDTDVSGYGADATKCRALNISGDASYNDQIFFLAPDPGSSRSDAGDLHEYGYFVLFAKADDTSVGTKSNHYYLVRHDISSSNPDYDPISGITVNANWYKTPTSNFGSSGKTVLLDNVLRFRLTYVKPDNTVTSSWTDPGLPRAIMIALTLADRRTAERLAVIAAGGFSGTATGDHIKIPDDMASVGSVALKLTLLQGARTFYKQVVPLNAR